MNIEEIYLENEKVTFESYLEKNNVTDIFEFLNPSGKYLDNFSKYNGIRDAVNEVLYWKDIENSKITIVQDCDCDGVLSTVEMYQYLKALKEDWDINILIHDSKQRGLEDEDVMNSIIELKPNLVIIPDAGTNNKKQAEELCKLGIGLIVLDHHDFESPIEKGYLISNQDTKNNVSRKGSGALVTHKFLQAIDNEIGVNWSNWFIDLVAMSLVSDSMDMSNMENRTYYYFGLETINCVNNEFLKKLIEYFIGDKPYTQRDMSFKIIPKINSVCRNKNMEYKQKLIMAFLGFEDYDNMITICNMAHDEQKKIVQEIIDKNIDKIESIKNNNIVIFDSNDIPRSYSGLVCGKIMNLCDNKPTITGSISDKYFIGSLRSPIPLRKELSENEFVDFAQGHEDSCGIGIKECNIKHLIDYYNGIQMDYTTFDKVLKSYSIKSIPNDLYSIFEPYNALWGKNLEQPIFHIKDIEISQNNISILGKDKRTLKIHTEYVDIMIFSCSNNDKIKFGLGYLDDKGVFVEDRKNTKLNIQCIGTLGINEYKGKRTNQIIVNKYELKELKLKSPKDVFK